jgi:ABC-type thiamine transport system ATPase subunit
MFSVDSALPSTTATDPLQRPVSILHASTGIFGLLRWITNFVTLGLAAALVAFRPERLLMPAAAYAIFCVRISLPVNLDRKVSRRES